ncbi:hypothetical protein Tdes44962_MAKER00230 [Teratosphaeria destructans]|uniref:Uncharacterized protein n=1 Tax=Teratosphaeria destructans TaxID=418781 RepID=A0A9W7SV33_9PEZI|nr:hypothetical protein Tdes44962_MAKER00230 [Teratosphaeria destructans]
MAFGLCRSLKRGSKVFNGDFVDLNAVLFEAVPKHTDSRGAKDLFSPWTSLLGIGGHQERGHWACAFIASRPHLGTLDILHPKQTHCIESSQRLTDHAASPPPNLPASAAFWTTDDLAALQQQSIDAALLQRRGAHGPRTAVVLRAWHEFLWTPDDIDNVRTMAYQLLRGSGGEYQLFILMQIRNDTADPFKQNVDLEAVPGVLRGMVEPWNQSGRTTIHAAPALRRPTPGIRVLLEPRDGRPPDGGLPHLPRALGGVGPPAADARPLGPQPALLPLPAHHGPYEAFANALLPDYAPYGTVEADLIAYFPLFNTTATTWMWKDAAFGYGPDTPRFGTVGTNMWPASAAYLHDLKAVFVPHAVFLEGEWSAAQLQRTFNAGPGGQVGGANETVLEGQEALEGSTWSWNARFGRELYEGWRGRRVDGGEWGNGEAGWCLPSVFLHPVKSSRVEPQGWH